MITKSFLTAAVVLPIVLASCGIVPAGPPERAEIRPVTMLRADSRTLTLTEPMVLANASDISSSGKGLRLPKGIYKVEAEDSSYLYYRAPSAIEYRVMAQGKVDQHFIPGGIALSKSSFRPGAVYGDCDAPNQRLVTRMLGAEFLTQEGNKWRRNP